MSRGLGEFFLKERRLTEIYIAHPRLPKVFFLWTISPSVSLFYHISWRMSRGFRGFFHFAWFFFEHLLIACSAFPHLSPSEHLYCIMLWWFCQGFFRSFWKNFCPLRIISYTPIIRVPIVGSRPDFWRWSSFPFRHCYCIIPWDFCQALLQISFNFFPYTHNCFTYHPSQSAEIIMHEEKQHEGDSTKHVYQKSTQCPTNYLHFPFLLVYRVSFPWLRKYCIMNAVACQAI